ncbi:MAG: cytochrome c biogenesis protein CcmE, partial [Gammaproteobacteria bacterium]|nr:cytochrome c biogenesis protein CcmE [Gammaproteobacteria bacterium]
MKPHRRKKLGIIIFIAAGLSVAVGFTAFALKQNINMFYTPTQVAEGEVGSGQHFRIGGMVKTGTVL